MFGTVKTCIISEDINVRGKTEARPSPQENKRKQKAEMVMTTRGSQWVMRLMASQNWKCGGGVTMFREMSYSPPTPLRNIYQNKNKTL